MSNLTNLYCLILAGGKGRRLWPESRTEMPKQFLDFFGTGRSQLQQMWDRSRKFLPADHILISTSINYVGIVKEQLPELPDSNILAEPLWRNTAPSIAWGAHRVNIFNKDSSLIVVPSDQQIIDDGKFLQDIETGYKFVNEHESMLILGVKPTRPEPGYGYIQMDEQMEENIFNVRSFTEKPEREFAKMFMESGEFLWNTGIIMIKTSYLMNNINDLLPSILRNIDASAEDFTIEDENRYMEEHFPLYPNISFEEGIMEKCPSAEVMHCHFGWADLGTWHSIFEYEHKAKGENVILNSDVITDNSHDNIIKIPEGHLAVINGLDGYIVVEKNDILLICPREDSSALIRKYSAEVEMMKKK